MEEIYAGLPGIVFHAVSGNGKGDQRAGRGPAELRGNVSADAGGGRDGKGKDERSGCWVSEIDVAILRRCATIEQVQTKEAEG